MTSASPTIITTPHCGHGCSVLAVMLGLLWCGLAIGAHGTALALPANLAAGTSLAFGLWLCRERTRLGRELAAVQAAHETLVAHSALLEAALQADIEQILAHSANLLGATSAELNVEPHAGAEDYHWSALSEDEPRTDPMPWWQDALVDNDVYLSPNATPARCAVVLRQDDVRLGVLAFEARHGPRAWDAREARLLRALAAVLAQFMLRQRLERALAESHAQNARERRLFLANLSHKLRTPMTAVLGFAQILDLDEHLTAEHREFVKEIEGAGRALLDMLNDLVGVPRE